MIEIGVGQHLRRRRPGALESFGGAIGETVEADLLPAARPVQEQVGRDPVQPALERARLEAVQRAEHPDEDVLGQILGVVRIPGEAVRQPVDPGTVIADDLLPGRRRPLDGSSDPARPRTGAEWWRPAVRPWQQEDASGPPEPPPCRIQRAAAPVVFPRYSRWPAWQSAERSLSIGCARWCPPSHRTTGQRRASFRFGRVRDPPTISKRDGPSHRSDQPTASSSRPAAASEPRRASISASVATTSGERTPPTPRPRSSSPAFTRMQPWVAKMPV